MEIKIIKSEKYYNQTLKRFEEIFHAPTNSKEGDEAVKGDDSGFIKFGSRVDIYLPLGTPLAVKLNQKVKGSQSIIATLK